MAHVALVYPESIETHALSSLLSRRVQFLIDTLIQYQLSFEAFSRSDLPVSFDDFDLVVAAGGDGTQLDAAMRLSHTPLCSVRLFPEKSVGFLCKLDFCEFPAFIQRYLSEKYKRQRIARLQCFVDDIVLPCPILNDALVANGCPARATRFSIRLRERQAQFCCSGIWVSTQPGSHGAACAAGAVPISEDQPELALYCIRECSKYEPHESGIALSDSFNPLKESPEICLNDDHSTLFLDGGLTIQALKCGQIVTFRRHRYDLVRLF